MRSYEDFINNALTSYYYANGKKIKVFCQKDIIAIKFYSRTIQNKILKAKNFIDKLLTYKNLFPNYQHSKLHFYSVNNSLTSKIKKFFSLIKTSKIVENLLTVYYSENNKLLMLTNKLVCKYKPEVSFDKIEELHQTFGLEKVENLLFSENTFLLKTTKTSALSSLEIANKLIEDGHAVFAHPEWIEPLSLGISQLNAIRTETTETTEEIPDTHFVETIPTPTFDPLFDKQWNLKKVKAQDAWAITRGNPNIKIAIIDEGFDINHVDLNKAGKIVDPIDFNVSPPDNNPLGDFSHGTACAGIATATQNNNLGISGIAPECRLIPIRASSDMFGSQVKLAQALHYAADNGADIISCSLGQDTWEMQDILRLAIDYAATSGRNGLGCIIFWASGEKGESVDGNKVATYKKVIAVGATNKNDIKVHNSPSGLGLDIVAPGSNSDIITLTNMGDGDIFLDPSKSYTKSFGGTSAATPLVAGIAALVLSVNPRLHRKDVRQILFDTADKVNASFMIYTPAPDGKPKGTRNDNYGYGRVNAEKAVLKAKESLIE